jgi:DNA-binding MarR family transcriptional regulator
MITTGHSPPHVEGAPTPAGTGPDAVAVPGSGSAPPTGSDGEQPAGSDAEMAARVRLAILRLSRRLRQQVAGGVTSSQVSALATVERLGTPTLGELASSEQVQPPSMTKIIVGLEIAGLVARQEDDADGRIVRVRLTAEGRRTLQRSRSLRTAYLVRRLRGLSTDERASLEDVVRLLEHLVEQP